MNRILSFCAVVALISFASPLAAQQSQPTPQSVPPAPPPGSAATSEALPPFPPMPQHRYVNVGGSHSSARAHRSNAHKATARSSHRTSLKAKPAHHRLTRAEKDSRYCHNLSGRRLSRNHKCVTLIRHEQKAKAKSHRPTRADKNRRYCDSLSHRKMMRNRTCVALMKKDKASEGSHRLTRTDKNVRYCESLSHQRMIHNRTCVTLMKKQKAALRKESRHTRAAHKKHGR